MIRTTRKQREALHSLFCRWQDQMVWPSYKRVRKSAFRAIGCGNAVFVKLGGMYIGIEEDGYTHT